jgi:drug/metabolite transporter (DMT)-like permease
MGGVAIPLWATWPALALKTREIPPLECMAIVFLIACLVMSCLERSQKAPHPQSSSWKAWIPALAFALGESGSAVFFLLATHHIAASEANLIMYLWPGMIVGLGAALRMLRLQWRHYLGILLGFTGAAVLLGGSALSLSAVGIGLSLLAGISWAAYCIFRLKWKEAAGPLLARGFGISAAACASLHLILEPSVMPTIGGATAAAVIGIVPAGLANLAWDEGFRRGDSRLLAIMAYATPLCSALILAVLRLELFTWRLVIGALVIVLAGMMSRTDE